MYDKNNIFAKIIRGEIPCSKIYEDEKVLFFKDINPQAKVHVLAIPKNEVINFRDFIESTNIDTVNYFFKKINDVVHELNLEQSGYRLITNDGIDSNQEVPHFHVHVLGGHDLGGMLPRK